MIIDTHTHLCDSTFDTDRHALLQRACQAGISAVISLSETMEDALRNLELADTFPIIKPGAGLYPTHLDPEAASQMVDFIRRHHHRLTAIGEVGLDYWVVQEESQRDIQQEIFKTFIRLSLELDIPLNVHSRSAGRHAVALLLAEGAKKVQLHAFDAKWGAAMPAVEAGYFFSVPASIVRSPQKQKLVKQLPLANLLLETDSPVLAPVQGERNEPANILIAVQSVAQIKNIAPQQVLEAAYENTQRLYQSLHDSPK